MPLVVPQTTTTDKLKNYERPLKIEFIDSFDLTDTGKVKRI